MPFKNVNLMCYNFKKYAMVYNIQYKSLIIGCVPLWSNFYLVLSTSYLDNAMVK